MPILAVGEMRLHYLEEGVGPPLLWLPGGNDSALLMLHAHRRLARRYRLICYDPRGQGESDAPVEADDYAPAAHVGDLLGVLDTLDLDRVVIGGHSRGGRTSVEFALAHPERVVAVVAADSPLLGVTESRAPRFRRYQATLAGEGVDAFLATLGTEPRHPERRAAWRAAAHRAGPAALIAQYEALGRLSPLTERLRNLPVPALFLAGDRDFLLEHARTAAEAAPNAQFVVIPDAGHAPFGENPTAYFAALEPFLARVTEGIDAPPAGQNL